MAPLARRQSSAPSSADSGETTFGLMEPVVSAETKDATGKLHAPPLAAKAIATTNRPAELRAASPLAASPL
jgi:hypothetical protein